MVEERGIVIGTKSGMAQVSVKRGTMCEGCQTGGTGCGATLMGESAGSEIRVEAKNPLGATEGDVVLLSISEGIFLKGSFIVYIIPVLFLITGGLLGPMAASSLGLELTGDAASALLATALFFLSFVMVGLYSRRSGKEEQYIPQIVRVIGNAATIHPEADCRNSGPIVP